MRSDDAANDDALDPLEQRFLEAIRGMRSEDRKAMLRVMEANVASSELNRGRERRSPSPPSEPGVRFSRDGLSSQLFPHRDWRANPWTSAIVNSPRSAKKAFGHCL